MERSPARTPTSFNAWLRDRSTAGVIGSTLLALLTFVVGPVLLGPTGEIPRFLVWNLALAWIPYVAAILLVQLPTEVPKPVRIVAQLGIVATWMLFLPNAPYLVSDLTHYDMRSPTPWLDLTAYVAFAWAGCALGVASLRIVHGLSTKRWGRMPGWGVVLVAIALTGPGVAMGRFARLNSWQVATRPWLVADEAARLGTDPRAVSLSVFFALLLLVMYVGSTARAER